MTKQDELDLLDELIGKLPAGYIQDILNDFRPGIHQAVMNDFGFVGWREAWQALRDLEAEQKRLIEERAKLVADVKHAHGMLDHCRDQLKDLRTTAETIARKAAAA